MTQKLIDHAVPLIRAVVIHPDGRSDSPRLASERLEEASGLARALDLDCGPMSGVDLAKVNAEFFPDGRLQANFLINLGWPAGPAPRARGPRLAFEQACVLA